MANSFYLKNMISGKTQLWLQVVRAAALADKNNESVDSGKLLEQMQRWFDCGNISFKQGLIKTKKSFALWCQGSFDAYIPTCVFPTHCSVVEIKVFSNWGKKPSDQSPLQYHTGKNKSVFKSGNKTFTSKPTAVQYHNGRNQNVFKWLHRATKASLPKKKVLSDERVWNNSQIQFGARRRGVFQLFQLSKLNQMKEFKTIHKSSFELREGDEQWFEAAGACLLMNT